MSVTFHLSRRQAIVGAAGLPLILGAGISGLVPSHEATASYTTPAARNSPFSHMKVGEFLVTTLLVGSRVVENPQGTFGMNVDAQTFKTASTQNFISSESFVAFFTPTIVQTGADIILFDAGLGDSATPAIVDAMSAAGYAPDDVTIVVLTHMHPDHIGGLMSQDMPTFPNANYVTGAVEYDFWSGPGAGNRVGEMFANLVLPLADKMTFLSDGDAVVPGITAMAAFGHTPGHMAYMLESNNQQLLLAADLANHFVWSLAYPDWEVRFDADKAAAAATRRRVLGMLASEKIPFIGYHMPFPAVGYVETRDNGFRYVPESYQLAL